MISLAALLQREFPVTRNLIYLNHAGVGPWPLRTADAVARFASDCAAYGSRDYASWLQMERDLKDRLGRFLNAGTPDTIALLKNTSETLSVVAHGLSWARGDSVVISDEEFPSNRIVWESLAHKGVTVRQVPLRGVDDPEAALLAACDRQTKLLSISSVQYASGLRMDLARLGAACRQRSIAFCVDAIQGLGAFAHDVEAMHIDFLAADAHKWLLAPEGVAVFYCRPEWRERLTLQQFGWHMVEDAGNFERKDWAPAHGARRFECGSPNMLCIHALAASLSLIEEVGIDRIEQRLLERARHLLSRIEASGVLEPITDTRPGRYAGIVTFKNRRQAPEPVYRRLSEHGVVSASRAGGIRFSPHFYTPLEQLDRALDLAEL
jgi:selenocysteine lyase/cysteine desulfurase